MTAADEPEIPGQMTVDECIEVAANGLDGKTPTLPELGEHEKHTHDKRHLTAKEVVRRKLKEG